jgi:Zn-dependent protease/predicted transcriptional regulator
MSRRDRRFCFHINQAGEAAEHWRSERRMFSHRIKLFALFGFQVWIDASWLLVGALIAWTLAGAVFPAAVPDLAVSTYWWMAIAATVGLLFSIVFHETAHSLVARRYGIEIRGITLFVFGGVAQMPAEPESARAEFLMALAGPVASLVLSAALFGLASVIGSLHGPQTITEIVSYLGLLNMMLAIFNLIPAFPLDGGRMLRAALWAWRHDIRWATRIAAGAGETFGLLLILLGVFAVLRGDFVGGMWQFLIGMFLRTAASAGYQQTMAQRLLANVSVAQVMTPDPVSAPPGLPITRFIEDYIYRYHHREFPVARDGLLLGRIGTRQIAELDRGLWPKTVVSALAVTCTPEDTISPDAGALAAITQMSGSRRSHLFVVRGGQLVGVISQRDLMELLSVKLELVSHQSPMPIEGPVSGRRAPG